MGTNESFAIVALIVFASCQTSAPVNEDAAPLPKAESQPLAIDGTVSTRYRGRFGAGDSDHDVYALLSMGVGDAKRNAWTGYLLGEVAIDVDGTESPSSPFYSLQDTETGAIDPRLYEAYVENHQVDWLSTLRIGRQSDYGTPVLIDYDGLLARSKEIGSERIAIGAYGGKPVHLYRATDSDDYVAGTFVEARPWTNATARFDWMHLDDEALLGQHHDDLLEIALNQSLFDHLRVDGSYSMLEGEDRDVSVRGTYGDPESDLTVQASWYRLLRTQNEQALDLDPFTSVLLEQFPYSEYRLMATKGFGASFLATVGADLRRVSDQNDVSEFNRAFDRWYATAAWNDLLPSHIGLSVTGEIWNAGADDIRSWGLDLKRDFGEKMQASIGSYYSLYKYDLFLVQERDDVRTYYLRLRYQGGPSWTCDMRYEYEDSIDAYSTLRMGATWRF